MSAKPRSKDPLAIAFWTIFAVVNSAFILPRFGSFDPGLLGLNVLSHAILLVPMWVLVRRALGTEARYERRFWAGLASAVALLWLAGVLGQVRPPDSIALAVTVDSVYAGSCLIFILALRADPEHRTESVLDRVIDFAGTLVAAVGFFVYFVVVSVVASSEEYTTGMPSLFLYIALDLLVLLEAARLWFANRDRTWRTVYAWLTLYATIWVILDALNAAYSAGKLSMGAGSAWEILWSLPAIPLFLAASATVITTRPESPAQPSVRWPWHRRTVLISALLFVIAHFIQARSGLLDATTSVAREPAMVVSLTLLGVLAIIQLSLLDREARRLVADREEAVRDAERRSFVLNSLIEKAPIAIVVLDPHHRIQVCNPAFEKLFQYDREESVGCDLDELISRYDSIQETRQYTREVEQGQSVEATVRRYRKDGTPVTVELTGLPMTKDGQLIGIFAVYQDITDRIEALRALRESEARYRSLVEHAPEAIVILDADRGHFTDCNREAEQLFGLSRSELLSSSPADLSPPRQPDGLSSEVLLSRFIQEAADSGQANFEWTHLDRDANEVRCEIRLNRMPATGRTMLRGSIIDISERLELRQQLRQAQRMEAVGQLAGGVAHDFNNLLTVIGGYCDLAMMRPEISDEAREELGEIRRASDSAATLTRQLLAFSRRQVMQPETVDLNEVVKGTEEMLRPLLGEQYELQTKLEAEAGKVHVDPGQMEQVIANLVVNARDALPRGGPIEITTGLETVDAPSGSHPAELEPGQYVTLKVADSGTGMEQRTLDQIFEPFFTTKTRDKGTGLGLSTVYGIIAQCGGRIVVDSSVGVGSTFTVYLPLADAEGRPQPSDRPMPTPATGSETVLVVEDEPAVRKLASTVLGETGFDVLTASNGEEALALAAERGQEIDLLLTDVVLPGLNGREIVEQIRSDTPELKVLFMSGYTDELIVDLEGNGDAPFLQKPFTPDGLVLKVRQVLDAGIGDPT